MLISFAWLHRRQVLLWWGHTTWALAWGVMFMWLGSRQFAWLRWAFVYIAFIWVSSRFLPAVTTWRRLSDRQSAAARAVVNYFNKNFYQQLLFFVLPIYWGSVTWGSPNVVFVGIVAVSALLATIDLVYDRHVAASRALTAVFFGFNLFVCLNVALPVLWSVSNLAAMRVSAVLALAGFATLHYRLPRFRHPVARRSLLATAVLLACFVEWGRPLVPPAPLRLVSAEFGQGIKRGGPAVIDPLQSMPRGYQGRIYGVSAIRAPLGLKDRVRHRWVLGARTVQTSPYYTVTGGRLEGFRLWTSVVIDTAGDERLDLWVETEGGQIIGRGRLARARP